jgi:hypothetical protein
MNNILSNKYFRFSIAATIYLLITIWIGNYWLLIGLAVISKTYRKMAMVCEWNLALQGTFSQMNLINLLMITNI